jgi:hypothetical protein
MFRRLEHENNTPAQVEEYIDRALALVERLPVPDDLRPTAFAKAVDLFASKQVTLEPIAASPLVPRLDGQ